MSTQTKNDKSRSTKEYFAERAKRMYAAEPDVQNATPIESSEQSMSSTPAETSERISSERGGEIMSASAAAPIRGVDVIKSSIDAPVPTGDVDEQTMHETIGAPIEADDVSVHTSHSTPDPDGEASATLTTTPNVEVGTTESGTPVHADRNDQTGARPAVDQSGKTGADTASTASTASSAHTAQEQSPTICPSANLAKPAILPRLGTKKKSRNRWISGLCSILLRTLAVWTGLWIVFRIFQ